MENGQQKELDGRREKTSSERRVSEKRKLGKRTAKKRGLIAQLVRAHA